MVNERPENGEAESRPRVLVVEDSATMRQLLCFALQRLGNVEIVQAGNGVEGLKVIRQGGVTIALVDINMPVMDGIKMVQALRQDPQTADLPVVIITTEGKEEMKHKARELGVEHYITKPINQSQVVNTIRAILQGRK